MTGNQIRALRLAHGITQRELAEATGIHQKTIAKWETHEKYKDKPVTLAYQKLLNDYFQNLNDK
jgi:transcriptional regulator with XRE-family HTH domain